MIEPIGLVGTLIAIIQISNKITSVCYDYKCGVRDAPQEISWISEEVTSVGNLAQRLLKVAEADRYSDQPSLQSMSAKGSILHKFLGDLTDLKTSLKVGKKSGLKSALAWPLKRVDVERKLRAIGATKATLELALSADNAENMLEILTHARSLPYIKDQMLVLARSADKKAEEDEWDKILHWLDGRDQSTKHEQEYQKYIHGTGDWLLNRSEYRDWKANPGKLLWVNGIAGCGKSVLCAKVIEDLQAHCEEDKQVSLNYFYIDGSDRRSFDIECLCRSLLAQLVPQLSTVPSDFRSWNQVPNQRGKLMRSSNPGGNWTRIYWNILELFDQSYIVLDGLDECEEHMEDGNHQIFKFIQATMKAAQKSVHLIAFSRDLEQFRNSFGSLNSTIVTMDSETVKHSLWLALKHHLAHQTKFTKWPDSVKNTIQTSLLPQANGSFRWVDCQLLTLRKCATLGAVHKALNNLPKSLETYYIRVLENIDEGNRTSVKNLLRWVAFSLRPLTLSEIASAIAINAQDPNAPFIDEGLELLDPDGFMDSYSSLVSTYCDIGDSTGSISVFVKLAHFTVREFLVSDAILNSIPDFAMETKLAHLCLATSGLVYFHCAVQSGSDNIWITNPLASYAAHFWPKHMKMSGIEWRSLKLQSTLCDLFDEDGPYYEPWSKIVNLDRPWRGEELKELADCTPLYCAAYLGLATIVKSLLDKGAPPDTSCGLYGTPLQAAAAFGYQETVEILLSANADPNAAGGVFQCALSAAAANGHIEVARKLLQAGAKANVHINWHAGGQRSDPLFSAVINEHPSICELLLEYGAKDYHYMKGDPQSALHAAVKSGRYDIVKTLLGNDRIRTVNNQKHSGVIRPVQSGITASQYSAAALGHVDILRELLTYGITKEEAFRYAAIAGDKELVLEYLDQGIAIDESAGVSDHPAALQSAAKGGHVAIVRELLARGADPNFVSDWSTPLQAAVSVGNIEIAQILIDAGAKASVNFILRAPLLQRRRDLLALLVKHGADTHQELREAVKRGDLRAFNILLEFGADIHRKGQNDRTSLLTAAAWGGSIPILRHLLDNGLKDQINPGPGETCPLLEAIRTQRWQVVELLLDLGADVNVLPPAKIPVKPGVTLGYGKNWWPPTPPHETALTMAVKEANVKIAHLLIHHGAMVTPTTPVTAGTPLLYAVKEGLVDFVNELLRQGADPNQKGTVVEKAKPTFPLLVATERGDINIMNSLLDGGADLNGQTEEGFSSLHVAARSDNPDALKLLLHKHGANMNAKLLNGSRPIHTAASRGTAETVRILLDASAPINGQNDTGRTPLHWAADSGNWETLEFLLERGADAKINSDDDGAKTALDMAYLTKEKPKWARQRHWSDEWDDERVERLLQRLKKGTVS